MPTLDSDDVTLSSYYPGAIGEITGLHATYYHDHWGFDISFETQVLKELSEFMQDFHVGPFTPERGASCSGGIGEPIL